MCVGGHGRVDEVETYAQIVGGFHNGWKETIARGRGRTYCISLESDPKVGETRRGKD